MAKRRQGRAFWAKLISEFESNGGRERRPIRLLSVRERETRHGRRTHTREQLDAVRLHTVDRLTVTNRR